MSATQQLQLLREEIPEKVKVVAVSKTRTIEEILSLYSAGQRVFGENRVKELNEKVSLLPNDIEWHMIGHLQRNKVKYIAPFISLIHSVDSPKLLEVINREAIKNERVIDCLLQIHIANEENKHGFSEKELDEFLSNFESSVFHGVRIRGMMGMATFTDDSEIIKEEFKNLSKMFHYAIDKYKLDPEVFNELSIGMSGDYKIAIDQGSTIVRIGSLIFGER